MNHFYGIESADLTLPEFLEALNSMGYVQKELRPKRPEEIAAEIAKHMAEMFEKNLKRKRAREDG